MSLMNLNVNHDHFEDDHGRRVMLRGVNLSGSSKVPFTPDGSTYIREGFFNHQDVSFVGRPFPLAEAGEHFERLQEWGYNFLRLLVTWEAIEHAGPGIYDQDYLDYLAEVVKKAAAFGFNLFIDPHQDVWSRFSGGDGAPGWTLEAVGFDPTHFEDTGAAIVHATHGDPYPKMIWSSNQSKLASATMFTIFFGGNDFAPNTQIDGEPAQEYLQRHYIEAIKQVAIRLKDLPNVLGYDTMNEPSPGYIGWKDLTTHERMHDTGDVPSPFQSMQLGAGYSMEIPMWRLGTVRFEQVGKHLVNPNHLSAWKEGHDCVWRQNGVWDIDQSDQPQLLKPNHFSEVNGKKVSFTSDYYRPFANRFTEGIRSIHPEALIFLETEPGTPITGWSEQDAQKIVYAPHWYDDYVLVKKRFSPFIGVDRSAYKVVFTPTAIRRSFRRQLAQPKQLAQEVLGGVPVILGEFGIPFDMRDKAAYRTGDFSDQVKALQRSLRAVEDNLLNYTLWNYTPDNTNLHGDLWNDEDLSIFSDDQRTNPRDINSGGRALEAVVRPYPIATAGELLEASFTPKKRQFQMKFRSDPEITAPTEIFVPNFQYPHGYSVRVSDGRYEIQRTHQRLLYWAGDEREIHQIIIRI